MKQELLKRLQIIIKDMSVNSLSSVLPEQFIELLEAPRDEVRQFVDDLYRERLITYKYKIECKCGNTGISYLRKLQREPYTCMECNQNYGIEDINQKGKLLYELEKSDILSYGIETVDFKRESLKVFSEETKEKEELLESGSSRAMEIFLGSSSEAVKDMENVAYSLEQLGKEPIMWNAAGKGIFVPNENTIDALIRIAQRVDAAVFIFSADDKIWHHNSLKESKTIRDNVLFEYGLFCGALSKSKVCFICKGHPALASDLDGITYIDGDAGDITIRKKLEDWLNAM